MGSRNQIDEERRTDISETWLMEKYPEAFRKLLLDHSRPKDADGNRHYIIWATDSYSHFGEGYRFYDEITPQRIVGEHGNVIQPRVSKSKEEQTRRVKDKAEVFTPSWICNAQNNLIDEAWFGRPDVFNREIILKDGTHSWIPTEGKIDFPNVKGKTWRDYVKDIRLEITCGEAPYLVSRYDTVTGERFVDLNSRIGILDRKLRVINENVHTQDLWRKWARLAIEATYGYEWLGDNIVLAREALLISVFEYHRAKFGKEILKSSVEGLAHRISWNIWQ
ncbi:MAG: restriction endonuclease subunit M, partial [Muribaculaceae bacterium]|nr:restriction endonuclease subunit M [Muribaculaceae bacterium]